MHASILPKGCGQIFIYYSQLVLVSCSKWHPDRHADKSASEKKKAEERFKDIAHAYETLSDPEKRRTYDQVRLQGSTPCLICRDRPARHASTNYVTYEFTYKIANSYVVAAVHKLLDLTAVMPA